MLLFAKTISSNSSRSCLKRTAASVTTTTTSYDCYSQPYTNSSKVSSSILSTCFSTISLATTTSSSTTTTRRMNNNDLDKDIEECHLSALKAFETTYIDPHTGFTVFTELLHLQRGKCCGNACRHCPYGWMNVDQNKLQNTGSKQRQQEVSVLLGTNSIEESRLAIQNRIQQIKALSLQQGQAETNGSASPISTPVVVVASVATSPATTTDPPLQPKKKTNMLTSSRSLSTTSSTTTTTKAASSSTTKLTTGGRKGGRKTTKNVPYTRTGDKGTSQLLTGERRSKSDLVFDAMGTVDELCSITGIVHSMFLMEQKQESQQRPQQESQQEEEKNALKQTTTTTAQDSSMENHDDDDKVDLNEWLLEIMSRLFDIGTHIANPQKRVVRNDDKNSDSESEEDNDNNDKNDTAFNGIGGGFDPAHIEILEDWIDIMTEQLPVLHSFILPTSGAITLATSHLHQARCVCRRAERSVVQLINNNNQKQHSATATTSTKDNKGDHEKECEDIYYYYVYDERAVQYLNRLSDFYFTAARWVHYDRAAALGMDGEQQEILYQRPFRGAKQRNRTTQKR